MGVVSFIGGKLGAKRILGHEWGQLKSCINDHVLPVVIYITLCFYLFVRLIRQLGLFAVALRPNVCLLGALMVIR